MEGIPKEKGRGKENSGKVILTKVGGVEVCPIHTIWYDRKKLNFDPYRSTSRFDPRKSVVDPENESH